LDQEVTSRGTTGALKLKMSRRLFTNEQMAALIAAFIPGCAELSSPYDSRYEELL
jgi:hypothetical protein